MLCVVGARADEEAQSVEDNVLKRERGNQRRAVVLGLDHLP